MDTTTWILIGVLVCIFLLYDYWKKCYFKRKGIPCEPPLPIIGHFHKFRAKGLVYSLVNNSKQYGKVFGLFIGSKPVIVVSDTDMLKEILIRHFSHFYNRRTTPFDDYPLNKSLPRLQGARWKEVRNTITPAFSASKMKPITSIMNNTCDTLTKHMKTAIADNSDVEVKRMFGNMTLDTIAQAAFGLQIDSQDNPKSLFVQHAKAFLNIRFTSPRVLIALFLPQLAPIYNFFNVGFVPTKAKAFFLDVTKQVMSLRTEEANKRVDMLQLMVDAHQSNDAPTEKDDIPELKGDETAVTNKKELTEAEIMAQALIFFLAGYETTNVALTLVSYYLALNPELQDRLYQEVQDMAPTRESVDYDTINKMQYLDMFLSECLRLRPPGVVGDRVCAKETTIGDITFEKGATIFYNIIAIHHDPDHWEDPEKFDPERFTKEASEKRHPFAYLPFGTGPRNCIGMRFALLVLKVAIVRVVQSFRFEPCEKTLIPLPYGMRGVTPDNGVTLRVIARE